jgi:glycosyltransferase involved in cell wall biosynthesis
MKIVHLITRLIIGGAQENTILSCEELHGAGHDVYLMAGPTTGPEGSLVTRAPRGGYHYEEYPHLVRQVSPVSDVRVLLQLQRRFGELKPDIVHTHSSKAGVIGRIAAHRARVPAIVHTIHGMSFNRTQSRITQGLYAGLERYCARRCHAIVSVADAMTRQALAAGIGRAQQYRTIRSGIVVSDFDPARQDARAIRNKLGIPEAAIVVGTVARLFRNKGYEQLIEIMQSVLGRNPALHFLWIGDGAQREDYERDLTRRGIRGSVTFAGLVPPESMPGVLSTIDILAHTSQWEGLPRAVVQALLMEKPVVSFDIDGAPEVVIPGQSGELVPLGDLEGFCEALQSLGADSRRRESYGRAGRGLCIEEFDYRKMGRRLEELYTELQIN